MILPRPILRVPLFALYSPRNISDVLKGLSCGFELLCDLWQIRFCGGSSVLMCSPSRNPVRFAVEHRQHSTLSLREN